MNIARPKRETICADAFAAMQATGHADDRTTANIYTHPEDEIVRKTGAGPDEVFARKNGAADVVMTGKYYRIKKTAACLGVKSKESGSFLRVLLENGVKSGIWEN